MVARKRQWLWRSSPQLSAGPAAGAVSPPSSQTKPERNSFPLRTAIPVCAAALPVVFIIFLVLRYAVAIPMLDDWEMVPLVVKVHTGDLTFADLFAQQQESRTFFPKLIFILFSFGKFWDGRAEMMLSLLFCCLTALGIYLLLGRSGISNGARTASFLLMVLLMFSPAQHELWLLASGFPSFVPAVCVVWALWVVGTEFSVATKFWLCLGLTLFASFTLANGLLAWAVTFPVLFAAKSQRGWKRWLGLWLIASAACAALYFWHFRPPGDLPSFAPRKSLLAYLQYVCVFLGSGLGRSGNEHPLAISTVVGAILLVGYCVALVRFAFRCRDREYCARVAPWIALGTYSVGSACLAALGRIEWGISQALESRYVTYSLYLTVAAIALTAIFATEVSQTPRRLGGRLALVTILAVFGAAYFTLEILCAIASLPMFQLRSAAARLGEAGVLFSQVMDTSKTIRSGNFPRPYFVRENAEALDRLHLLRTPLVRVRDISQLRHSEAGQGTAAGWFDGLKADNRETWTAWGWAALPGRGRPADGVVLAYADQRGDWIAFALSDAVFNRPDVARIMGSSEQLWTGWRAEFPRTAAPAGAQISAWALDAKDAKLYRLKSERAMLNQ
jgi:hypothetical protein